MLSERDTGILSTLAEMRFLTTSQVHRLCGYGGPYGLKVTRRKLSELVQRGLIKSWQPSKYEEKIFYLSKAGAREMEYYLSVDPIPTYRRNEKTQHQILVSEVYVQLKSAPEGRLVHFGLGRKIGPCIPDAHILYEAGPRQCEWFLEVDRETESIVYLRDIKLEQYRRLFAQIGPAGGRLPHIDGFPQNGPDQHKPPSAVSRLRPYVPRIQQRPIRVLPKIRLPRFQRSFPIRSHFLTRSVNNPLSPLSLINW